MSSPKHWFSDIYQLNYYMYLGVSKKKMLKIFKKEFSYEAVLDHKGGTCIFNHGRAQIVIWIKDKRDLPVLVHECVHAATFTLDSRGVPISFDNDEALAYLVGAIFRKATE